MVSHGELSKRELQILELVSTGKDNEMIGVKLGISRSTVKTHLRNIYIKTNHHDRVNLAISYLTSKT